MTKEKLKLEFHKLIDNIEDKKILENFYVAVSDCNKRDNSIDIIDELSDDQRARLMKSIGQVSDKDSISDEKMKDKIKTGL